MHRCGPPPFPLLSVYLRSPLSLVAAPPSFPPSSPTSIQKELQELSAAAAASPPGVLPPFMAGPNGADLYAWTATVAGPAGSPYARGLFFLDLRFPGNYPFSPPAVVLRTRVYHPNLAAGRAVASRALSADGWSAATTVADVLRGIRELLAEPAPHEPVVGSVAQQHPLTGA